MGKKSWAMKYSWIPTNSGWSRKRCNLHRLQNFACYFILIVFFREPTEKQYNNRSNYRYNTPTSQSLSKQEKEENNNPVKHQKAQLQPHDPNPVKLNQTTISNIERTNEQASTSEPVMLVKNNISQIHCRQNYIQKSEETIL